MRGAVDQRLTGLARLSYRVTRCSDSRLPRVTITNDQETRLVEPLRGIDVVDTTGAGDTLCGALAAELARGFPLYDAVRHAVSAATLSVSGSGARGAMPSYDQLLPYLSR